MFNNSVSKFAIYPYNFKPFSYFFFFLEDEKIPFAGVFGMT